ncbi:MAG: hypothetical protein GOV00_00170 [Candidatus Altiarchaeota archaeon]|nr:hypothetical protein [Candidatus Altiarchaeota archaeon]
MVDVKYSDFAKLDLRVGTVEKADRVQGADKLYKLEVNLGTEKRTLVAGLRQWYEPMDLIGKQLIIIANLEPKIIKGIKSHGMLLAGQDSSKVALLRPDMRLDNGAKVM